MRDDWANTLGLAFLTACGALFFNTQPVIVGALATEFAFDEQQLGVIVGAGLLSSFVVLCSSFFWIRHAQLKVVVPLGIALGLVAQVLLYQADGYLLTLMSVVLLGGGMAVIFAPVLVALGGVIGGFCLAQSAARGHGTVFFMSRV